MIAIEGSSKDFTGSEKTPASEDLFALGDDTKLDKDRADEFHHIVVKGLFVSKHARPDIQPPVIVLYTRVKAPNVSDCEKLMRLLKHLNGTRDDVLTLSADDLYVIKWYTDAVFAVHPGIKSYAGGTMSFGHGAVRSLFRKQKLNARGSADAELVGADDGATPMLWTKLFMEAQGYLIESSILLEVNGKKGSSKRTRALNMRYFFLS